MNSQFKNSSLGTYIYAFLILIMTAAVIFIFWYMYSGYKLGTYSENTVLGSVYVGGLKEDEVEPLLDTRINRWLGDETVVFEATYQGYKYSFDREMFSFDINNSVSKITDGTINNLDVLYLGTYKEDIIQDLKQQPYLIDIKDNINYDKLISDILHDASLMKQLSSKELEDYLVNEELSYGPIGLVDVYVPNGINIDELIQKIEALYDSGHIELPEEYLFDVIKELGSTLGDAELTVISLGMMDLILETNFSIDEVHYENKIPDTYDINTFPYFGKNVKIFERSDESFTFYNPNDSHYYFDVTTVPDKADHIRLVLYGLPFVNDITIDNSPPITIIERARITLTEGVSKPGIDGVDVVVIRTITDVYGNIIYNKQINSEFYPPKVQIDIVIP